MTTKTPARGRLVAISVAAAALLVAAVFSPDAGDAGSDVPRPAAVGEAPAPLDTAGASVLVDQPSLTIKAGDFHHSAVDLERDGTCAIRGSIQGLAGGEKDVTVTVLTDAQMLEWLKTPARRDSAPALYRSPRESAITFDVPVAKADMYHLLISNAFSVGVDKTVRARAALRCAR